MTEKGHVHTQQNTFGKSPYMLLTNTTISDGAARLYAYMHWRYGSNKNNHEGRKSMAQALGRNPRTITKYLAELEQSDWIVIIYRKSTRGRTTSFYHVFETSDDCSQWRKSHKRAKPSRKITLRKGRAGIGGKPSHKQNGSTVNSSSPSKQGGDIRNLSSATPLNSSSDNPDSVDPDSKDSPAKKTAGAKPKKTKKTQPAQPHIALIDAYWSGLPAKPPDDTYKRHVRKAKALAKSGITPDNVTCYMAEKYRDRFWQDKTMSFEHIWENVGSWLKKRKPPQAPAPTAGEQGMHAVMAEAIAMNAAAHND